MLTSVLTTSLGLLARKSIALISPGDLGKNDGNLNLDQHRWAPAPNLDLCNHPLEGFVAVG